MEWFGRAGNASLIFPLPVLQHSNAFAPWTNSTDRF